MSTNWTKQSKNAVTYTKEALTNVAKSFLLMEDGFRLLYEDLSRILLENGLMWRKEAKVQPAYTKIARHAATYTKEPKPFLFDYLLFQDSSVFVLEDSSYFIRHQQTSPIWTKEAKN